MKFNELKQYFVQVNEHWYEIKVGYEIYIETSVYGDYVTIINRSRQNGQPSLFFKQFAHRFDWDDELPSDWQVLVYKVDKFCVLDSSLHTPSNNI